MDVNPQELEAAAAVLRQQFGNRLEGSLEHTQVQMRRALEQALGLDEVAADRLVKQLTHTGRLVYQGGTGDVDDAGTGLMAPLPGTVANADGDPRVVPPPGIGGAAGPDMAGPTAGMVTAPATANTSLAAAPMMGVGLGGVAPLGRDRRSTPDTEDVAPIGETISPREADRAYAENREGATVGGQLADTNVAGPSSPTEQVVAGGDEDGQGYWQIA